MAKSSGNFKKAKAHAEDHNSRKKEPYYLLPSEFRTPNNRGSEFVKFHDARELFDHELAKKNATKARGKRPRFENSVFEIEINCNEEHTLDDGIKLSKELEQLLNYTCCSIALHRDEGHLKRDKNGKVFPIYNYHYHLVFETYKDGTQWARHEHNQEVFKNDLQDVIAASLNMQRGETKEDRLKRVAEKLSEPLELVQRQKDETAKQWYGRLDKLAEDKGIVDFKAYFELKPRKHINSSEYRQVAQELEQTVLSLEETEQLFNEHLRNAEIKIEELESSKTALESQKQTLEQQNSQDKKTISKLTNDKTVLSNEKQNLNSELLTLKQQKAQIEAERKKYKDDGDHIAEEYRKLQELNKTLHTQEELDKALAELRQQYEERIKSKDKEITDLKEEKTVLSNKKTELETTIQTNKQTNEQQITEITDNFNEVIGKQSENYKNLKTNYDNLFNLSHEYVMAFSEIGKSVQVCFNDGDDVYTYINTVRNTVLSNIQKSKEITKTVTREMTEEEIKQSEPYQTLSNSYDTCFNAFKTIGQDLQVCFNEGETISDYIDTVKNKVKSISKPSDFTFKVKANDLKTKKFGIWSEETAQGTADRINAEIRKQIEPIIQHSRSVDDTNENLTKENEELKEKNTVLSNKVNALTKEISLYFKALVIPFYEKAQDRLKSFTGWVKDFIYSDEQEIEELKQKLYDRATKKEQPKDVEKEIEKSMGFSHHDQEEERGGRSR